MVPGPTEDTHTAPDLHDQLRIPLTSSASKKCDQHKIADDKLQRFFGELGSGRPVRADAIAKLAKLYEHVAMALAHEAVCNALQADPRCTEDEWIELKRSWSRAVQRWEDACTRALSYPEFIWLKSDQGLVGHFKLAIFFKKKGPSRP